MKDNLYFLYYHAILKDFRTNGKTNLIYLILNFILGFIVSFFGCVYNEFIILFCCGLDHDTHYQITKRANANLEMELSKLNIDIDKSEGQNSLIL